MLQPRVVATNVYFKLFLFCYCFCSPAVAQLSDAEPQEVKPTPALNQDVTTVLLVDNSNRPTIGKFLSLKPELGLLKSTARTFIQDGVTTEYATQVLGTTFDNGRLYAQLLTTTSRVIYERDDFVDQHGSVDVLSSSTQSKSLTPPITKIVQPMLRQQDQYFNEIDPNWSNNNVGKNPSLFIKNTDYIAPNNAILVYPSKHYNNNDYKNYARQGKEIITAEYLEPESQPQVQVIPLTGNEKNRVSFTSSKSSSSNSQNKNPIELEVAKDGGSIFKPDKVKSDMDLPTFTVRNEFAPSGFSFDDPVDMNTEPNEIIMDQENRNGKLLYRGGVPTEDTKSLTSVTYYGFADFTTIVGDTVIIFSPSTQPPLAGAHVTSISGEATLKDQNIATTIKTFMSHTPAMETHTVTGHSFNMATTLPTLIVDSHTIRDGKDMLRHEYELESEHETTENIFLTTQATSELPVTEADTTENQLKIATTPELETFKEIEKHINKLPESMILSPDAIQPSETTTATTKLLSTPSSDDIAKIFASLVNAKAAAVKTIQEKENIEESETQVLGGVTTIFFEEDPFSIAATATQSTSATLKSIDTTTPHQEQAENETKGTTIEETPTTEKQTITPKELDSVTQPSTVVPVTEDTTDVETTTKERNIGDSDTTNFEQKSPTTSKPEVKTDVSNDKFENDNIICASQVIPTTLYQTSTFLTTFYIPLDDQEDESTTSLKSNIVVSSVITYNKRSDCPIEPTAAVEAILSTTTIEKPEVYKPLEIKKKSKAPVTEKDIPHQEEKTEKTETNKTTKLDENKTTRRTDVTEATTMEPTTMEIVTERKHVTEGDVQSSTPSDEGSDDELEDEDEVELLYKTFYTTYTYLTTFFHESTSSISSRKEVVTNIITSTLNPDLFKSDGVFVNLINGMAENGEVLPTRTQKLNEDSNTNGVGIGRPTTSYKISESDLAGINQFLQDDKEASIQATPALNENDLETEFAEKTLYTTYTYFTTIFVDGETELSSRTEVFTNIIKADIATTSMADINKPENLRTNALYNKKNEDEEDNDIFEPISKSQILLNAISKKISEDKNEIIDNQIIPSKPVSSPKYSTMSRGSDSITEETEQLNAADEQILTMVTDVRSSSSHGDTKIIENKDKNENLLLEDQISSESNTEEIMPSATLLLQTSYTTFTYFTTMYVGSTSSNILSRLETVTNVATETLKPTLAVTNPQADEISSISLPVTYFTTFTYWTTLFKDGITSTTSREETISNVITPSVVAEASVIDNIISNSQIIPTAVIPLNIAINPTEIVSSLVSPIQNEKSTTVLVATAKNLEPTTYYTTYTYFTTSYIGDQTVLNSRLETVTNVVTPTPEVINPTARSINFDAKVNQLDFGNDKEAKTKLIQPVYAVNGNNINSNDVETLKPHEKNVKPTGIVSINQGKIVDAEGISTIFYTTKAIGTYVNDLYAQILESTSSVQVDEVKKMAQTTESTTPGQRIYKTGLVRLIEGTQISNRTTTLYQSKVIGTIIDGRYAQIIESTSSFLIEKTLQPTFVVGSIQPSKVLDAGNAQIEPTSSIIAPTPAVVESSISDGQDEQEEDYEDEEDELDEDGKKKPRLGLASRKRTFTPYIRPFASRNRPTFNPKRKNGSPNSATIITRSDFTPTITATPALKSESSKNRFSVRRSSSGIQASGLSSSFGGPVSGSSGSFTGSRKFARPKASSTNGIISPSSNYGGARGRSSSGVRIQPSSTANFVGSSSARRPGFRGSSSSTLPPRSSSSYPLNTRLRPVRPSLSSSLPTTLNSISYTTPSSESEEDDDVTATTDDEEDDENEVPTTTTEVSRRNQNPLLKFRRPQIGSGRSPAATTSKPTVTISTRRSPLARTTRLTTVATTTTQKPRARSFSRPPTPLKIQNPSSQSRARPASNLFPPRGLFRTTPAPVAAEDEEKDGSNDENDLDDDSDYEESNIEEVRESGSSNISKRSQSSRSLVGLKSRNKRQIEYGTRSPSYQPRYRRPTTARSRIEERNDNNASDEVTETTKPPVRPLNRFATRSRQTTASPPNPIQQNSNSRIRPTSTSSQNRAQFTLRDNGNSNTTPRNSFRRPTTASSRRNTTPPRTSSSSRFRSYSNTESNKNTKQTTSRRANSGSRRNTSRSRSRNDNIDFTYVQPSFDGTITVTHHIPTETRIPTVQNGVTEYKNILTDRTSKEVLGPKQYSTSVGANGIPVIALTSEITGVNNNGYTEVTQFLLNETPTTSIIFTPTTIRGRKTSYSHIIPSTIYQVEQVVSTIQQQISANAPLANILLSQLLLGNLGLPQQQQNLNPLLNIQQPQQNFPQVQPTPTTELITRTTTYVTTVTTAVSTVIPLTFRGKEILTTIVESSTNVVTATEFIVDTVVSTPTATILPQLQQQNQQQQQLAQLLPLLLQQQQQQQQQPNQVSNIALDSFLEDLNLDNKHFDNIQSIRDSEVVEFNDDGPEATTKKSFKKSGKKNKNKRPTPPPPPQETSIITLYVSGRRPGEFSTVLSTVIVGQDESGVRKRSANYIAIKPSQLPTFVDNDDIDIYVMAASNSINEVYDSGINLESSQYSMGIENDGIDMNNQKLFEHTPTLENTQMPFFRLTDFSGGQIVQPQSKVMEKTSEGTLLGHNTFKETDDTVTTYAAVQNSNPNNIIQNRSKRNALELNNKSNIEDIDLSNSKYSKKNLDNFKNSSSLTAKRNNMPRLLRRKKILRSVHPVRKNNDINDEKRSTTTINSTRRRVAITRKTYMKVLPTSTNKKITLETNINTTKKNTNYSKTEPNLINNKRRKIAVTRKRPLKPTPSTLTSKIIPNLIEATPVFLEEVEKTVQPVAPLNTLPKGKYRNPKYDAQKFSENKTIMEEPVLPVVELISLSLPSSSSIITSPLPISKIESFELETSLLETLVYSSTRTQTLTFVVTRVSNDESLITTSTSYRDQIKPVTTVITKIQTLSIIPVDEKNTLTLTIVPTKFTNIEMTPTVTLL